MATLGAARALQLHDRAGTLERGKRADFLVMKMPGSPALAELAESIIEQGQLRKVFVGGDQVGPP